MLTHDMIDKALELPEVKQKGRDEIRRCIREAHTNWDRSYSKERLPWVAKNMRRHAAYNYLWKQLEEQGLVKMEQVEDCMAYEDLLGDCYDVDTHKDTVPGGERTILAELKRFNERVDEYGTVGVIGYYRLHDRMAWVKADSLYGIIGDEVDDNEGVDEVRFETLEKMVEAVESVCPRCQGKGTV